MRCKMCNQRGNATYNQASGERELLYPRDLHFYLHILFFFGNNVPVNVDLI